MFTTSLRLAISSFPLGALLPVLGISTECDKSALWIVVQVQGTGCRLGQVREPAITGWVNWWGPTGSGSWYSTGLSNLWVPTRSTTWRDLVTLYRTSLWKSWWYSPFYDAQTIWNLLYFFRLDFGGIKLRQWWQNLAKFEPGLCHHCPFSLKAPTVAKNGATVTMSSGKSFDHQLALALQADMVCCLLANTSLLLTCWCVINMDMPPLLWIQVHHSIVNWLWLCKLMHHSLVCCLLTNASLSLTYWCVLVACLLIYPCRLLTNASLSFVCWCILVTHSLMSHRHGHATVTMSSGKPFDHQFIQYTVPLSFLPGVGLLQLMTLYQTRKWPVHTLHFSIRLLWWLILQVSAVCHTYIPLLSTFTNVWAGSSTSRLCVVL